MNSNFNMFFSDLHSSQQQQAQGMGTITNASFMNGQQKLSIDTSFQPSNFYGIGTPRTPTSFGGGNNGSNSSTLKRRTNYTSEIGPSFTQTKQLRAVWNADKTRAVKFNLMPKIDKGFFLNETDWVCYRRNYFQVSACYSCYSMSNSAGLMLDQPVEFQPSSDEPTFIEHDGRMILINGYRIGISARVASSERVIDLVQHTSKRDKGPQVSPAPRPCQPSTGQVTFERLQFKSATANNGKRRAAQQYYVVDLELYAELSEEMEGCYLLKMASSTSCPLVVRGRSPGHYTDSLDRLQSPYGMMASATLSAAENIFSANGGNSMFDRPATAHPLNNPNFHTTLSALLPQSANVYQNSHDVMFNGANSLLPINNNSMGTVEQQSTVSSALTPPPSSSTSSLFTAVSSTNSNGAFSSLTPLPPAVSLGSTVFDYSPTLFSTAAIDGKATTDSMDLTEKTNHFMGAVLHDDDDDNDDAGDHDVSNQTTNGMVVAGMNFHQTLF